MTQTKIFYTWRSMNDWLSKNRYLQIKDIKTSLSEHDEYYLVIYTKYKRGH